MVPIQLKFVAGWCYGKDGGEIVEILKTAYISSLKGKSIKLPLDRSPDFKKILLK